MKNTYILHDVPPDVAKKIAIAAGANPDRVNRTLARGSGDVALTLTEKQFYSAALALRLDGDERTYGYMKGMYKADAMIRALDFGGYCRR